MDRKNEVYWIFQIKVMDCAGALTSVSAAFSNESINIDTAIGHAANKEAGTEAKVAVSFWANEEEKDIMLRKIQRLSKAIQVECRRGKPEDMATPNAFGDKS
jgi:ACT domain-containing protein